MGGAAAAVLTPPNPSSQQILHICNLCRNLQPPEKRRKKNLKLCHSILFPPVSLLSLNDPFPQNPFSFSCATPAKNCLSQPDETRCLNERKHHLLFCECVCVSVQTSLCLSLSIFFCLFLKISPCFGKKTGSGLIVGDAKSGGILWRIGLAKLRAPMGKKRRVCSLWNGNQQLLLMRDSKTKKNSILGEDFLFVPQPQPPKKNRLD